MPSRAVLPTNRLWWGALLLLIVLAGALYYTGYRVSLPYVDHPDEPSFNLAAQMILDSGTAKPMGYNAYPPGIITLNYLVLKAFNQTVRHPASDFIPLVRLITVTAALCSVLVIAVLGWELAGGWAGLLSALIWAVNPIWNASLRFATADPFITLFALLSLWLVCAGTRRNRQVLNTAATYVLMLAIVFKTQAIFLLPLIWCLPLVRGWTLDPSARPALIRAWLWNGFRWGLFLCWLLVLYPTLDANKIVQWVAPTDKMALPAPQLLLTHLNITLLATRPLLAWLGVVAILAVAFWRMPDVLSRSTAGAVGLALVMFLFGVSLFGEQSARQMYVILALGDLLAGAALALAAAWLAARLASRPSLPASVPKLVYGGVLVYTLLSLLPAAHAALNIASNALKPDRRNELAAYMDTTLLPAPYITTQDNHKTLNRDYGGYHGLNDFPLVAVADVADKPLADWRTENVAYAITPYNDTWKQDARQVILLKSFPEDPAYRGPSMNVLRLQPIQYRLNAPLRLGTLRLIGYDLSDSRLKPGESLSLTYYWQADAPTDVPYRVFTHLYPLDTVEVVAQQDGLPLPDDLERRPTSQWDDPAEILVSRTYTVDIPAATAPGRYRLVLGFYDPVGQRRLAAPNGDSFITVAEIDLLPLND